MAERIIAVCGRKGGVGKSTLALILGAQYAKAGRSVLLVDLDPQGSASALFSLDVISSGATRVLLGESDIATEASEEQGIRFLTGGADTAALAGLPGGPEIRPAVAGKADVVLIDCPPGHDALDLAAMRAADVVLIGTEAHRAGIAGAFRVLDDIKALPSRPKHAVVLGRLDPRRNLDAGAVEVLAGMLAPVPVFSVRQDSTAAADLNVGRIPRGGRAWDDVERIRRWIR